MLSYPTLRYYIYRLTHPQFGVGSIIKLQIVVITIITVFVSYQLYQNPSLLSKLTQTTDQPQEQSSNNQAQESIAGVSTDAQTIPSQINITVDTKTSTIKTSDFNFRFTEIEREEPKSLLDKVLDSILGETTTREYFLEFDEEALKSWIITNFSTLITPDKINSELGLLSNPQNQNSVHTDLITSCTYGQSATKVPVDQIISDIKGSTELATSLNYPLIYENLTDKDLKINDICNKINNFENIMSVVTITLDDKQKIKKEYEFLSGELRKRIFEYQYVNNDQFKISIVNEQLLRTKIESLKPLVDFNPQKQDYRINNGQFLLVGDIQEGKIINVDRSIEEFKKILDKGETVKQFPIILDDYSSALNVRGQNVQTFPKEIGIGTLRTSLSPVSRSTNIQNFIARFDGIIVNPNEEFSFINTLNPESFRNIDTSESVRIIHDNTEIIYPDSIQVVASALYRSILNSGFPIVDRLDSLKILHESEYTHPYNSMVSTSVVSRTEDTAPTESGLAVLKNKDLKFKNDSRHPIVIVATQNVGEDGLLYIHFKIFSTENSTRRNVELKNFQKINTSFGFTEVFSRIINGREEKFRTNYYR